MGKFLKDAIRQVVEEILDEYFKKKDIKEIYEAFPFLKLGKLLKEQNQLYEGFSENDEEIDDRVRSRYYHLTPYTLGDKILKNGLCPRGKEEHSSNRVYLLSKKGLRQYRDMIEELFKNNKQDYDHKKTYYVLEVDTCQPDHIPVRLFYDPKAYESFYTLENIHPKYIKLVRKVYLNKNGKIFTEEKIN